jgi:hypothetical protein
VLALLDTNTIGLSTRFHYPVDPICRGPDFTVRYERGATDGRHGGCPFWPRSARNRPPSQRESDKPNGGAIQRRRVSEAAKSEGVPAKRVPAKRVSAKRVTAKRVSAKRMTPT